MWYSRSAVRGERLDPADDLGRGLELGAKAKEKGKYLFVWGKEAATYYQTMAVDSAIKEGGDEVRLALENLKPRAAGRSRPCRRVFTALKEIIDDELHRSPAARGTQFTAAQAQWTQRPAGAPLPVGLVDRERDEGPATKDGFADDGRAGARPSPPDRRCRTTALHVRLRASRSSSRPTGKNVAGGKELLRVDAVEGGRDQLRQDASSRRPSSRAPCPPTGSARPRWSRRRRCSAPPASDIFNYQFVDYYGTNTGPAA